MRIKLVTPEKLIDDLARELAKMPEMAPPAWASYVKTGVHKERPPSQDNWWYVRGASILRKVALTGPVGTNKLRVSYGGRKNRGHKPDKFKQGSGNIIRTILQQLEAAGLVKQADIKGHKGRVLTPKGHKLVDGASR